MLYTLGANQNASSTYRVLGKCLLNTTSIDILSVFSCEHNLANLV